MGKLKKCLYLQTEKMPQFKYILKSRLFELKRFGGVGTPRPVYDQTHEGNGLTRPQHSDKRLESVSVGSKRSGNLKYRIFFDEETKEIRREIAE